MDVVRFARAYWPSLVAVAASVLAMVVLLPLKDIPQTIGLFLYLRWVPMAGLAFAVVYGAWITYRFRQAEQGEGPLCPYCGGPLGVEKFKPFSPHRTCLACGKHANERHYRE